MIQSFALNINKFSISYKQNSRKIRVIENMDLKLNTNEFGVLIGPSGCGKTTLLMAIADILNYEDIAFISGDISIFGESINNAKKMKSIGIAFQNPSLLPWLSVKANIELPTLIGVSELAKNQIPTEKLVHLTGLKNFQDYYPSQLSGGLSQRVNLARALILKPKLLLLDEPVSNLDYYSRDELLRFIRQIHNELNLTTLMVTHDLRETAQIADCVYILNNSFPTVLSKTNIRINGKFDKAKLLIEKENIISIEEELALKLGKVKNT